MARALAWLVALVISDGHIQAQSELLRAKVRAAIPQMLAAVASLNERRSGRSDRSADFRILARWFADTEVARNALARLEMLRLVRRDAGGVYPLPALARFALGDAELVARKRTVTKGAERAQDALF